MPDIRFHRLHASSPPHVKKRLEPHIREIAKSYGLLIKWVEHVCYFDGPARGYLRVMDDSVPLLANFSPTALLFKTSIEQSIRRTLDKALR